MKYPLYNQGHVYYKVSGNNVSLRCITSSITRNSVDAIWELSTDANIASILLQQTMSVQRGYALIDAQI
jgi:hypothetical protein